MTDGALRRARGALRTVVRMLAIAEKHDGTNRE